MVYTFGVLLAVWFALDAVYDGKYGKMFGNLFLALLVALGGGVL